MGTIQAQQKKSNRNNSSVDFQVKKKIFKVNDGQKKETAILGCG
jgi:hypothetical protein